MRTAEYVRTWRQTSPHACFVCGDPVGPDGVLCPDCTGEPPGVQLRFLPQTIRLACGCIAHWQDLGGVTEASYLFRIRPVICRSHGDTFISDLLRIPGELTRETRFGVALVARRSPGRLWVEEVRLGHYDTVAVHGAMPDLTTAVLYSLAHLARRRLEAEAA